MDINFDVHIKFINDFNQSNILNSVVTLSNSKLLLDHILLNYKVFLCRDLQIQSRNHKDKNTNEYYSIHKVIEFNYDKHLLIHGDILCIEKPFSLSNLSDTQINYFIQYNSLTHYVMLKDILKHLSEKYSYLNFNTLNMEMNIIYIDNSLFPMVNNNNNDSSLLIKFILYIPNKKRLNNGFSVDDCYLEFTYCNKVGDSYIDISDLLYRFITYVKENIRLICVEFIDWVVNYIVNKGLIITY